MCEKKALLAFKPIIKGPIPMAKRIIIFALFLIIPIQSNTEASERPTIAIIPFKVEKNRSRIRWLGQATTSSLIEKLLRFPSVRVLKLPHILNELEAAKIDPKTISWAPSSAIQGIGKWLDSTILVIGAIGEPKDRILAQKILQGPISPQNQKGTDIWFAIRMIDIKTGKTLNQAFEEGKIENIFNLNNALFMHLIQPLQKDESQNLEAIRRFPTHSLKAYQRTSEAEQLLLKIQHFPNGENRQSAINQALKKIKTAIKIDKNFATAHLLQGNLQEMKNLPNEAIKAYHKSAGLDPNFSAPRYGLVDLALQQNDLMAAKKSLEEVTHSSPWDDKAHHLLGKIYNLMGDSNRALSAFGKALELHADRHDTLFEISQLYMAQNQTQKAIQVLEQAINLIPGEASFHLALATAYTTMGQYSKANDVFKLTETFGMLNLDLLFGKGYLKLKTGNFSEAIGLFNKVLKLAPERSEVHKALGETYFQQKRFKKTIEAFQRALALKIDLREIVVPFGKALESLNRFPEAINIYQQVLKHSTNRDDIRFILIENLLAQGKKTTAIEELKKAVQINPKNERGHLFLGNLYFKQGLLELGIEHIERALELGVDDPETIATLGSLYLNQGQIERAKKTFKRALAAKGPNAELFTGLGATEERLGNLKAAFSAYQQALQINPRYPEALSGCARIEPRLKPSPPSVNSEFYVRRGKAYIADGDLKKAENDFKNAVWLTPKNAALQNDLGTVYAKLGNLKKAEISFRKAIKLKPDAPEGHYNLGRLCEEVGLLDDAIAAYQQALQIDPAFNPAQINLGAIFLSRGEENSAVKTFQKALSHDPENRALYLSLGNAYLKKAAFDQAAIAYQIVKDQKPQSQAAEIGLGNAAFEKGDTIRAISHFKKAISLNPENPVSYINLGTAYAAQGILEAAIVEYQRALELTPEDPTIFLNLSVLLYQSEQYSEARNYCQVVLNLDPKAFMAQQMLGIIAQAMGNFQTAVDAFHLALKLRPKNPDTHKGLAVAFESLGNTTEASKHWKQWLALVQEDSSLKDDVDRISERLKELSDS